MNDKYINGVKWLKLHGFTMQDNEPCYNWMKDGVGVFFLVNSSDWCATFNGWMGYYCDTPELAISNLHEDCRQQKNKMLKVAQKCDEAIERLGKVLENEDKDGR